MVLTQSAISMMPQAMGMVQKASTPGLEDVLNEIVWMKSLPEIMDTLIKMGTLAVVIIFIISILQCFFGYTVFRYELALVGAGAFGVVMYLAGRFLLHWTGAQLTGATLFAAFMGAGMLFNVSAIIVFLFTLVGSTVALTIMNASQHWDMLPQVIIVISLAIALICLIVYKHVIIIGNVVLGAGTLGLMMAALMDSDTAGYICGGVCAVIGLVIQYVMYFRKKRKEKAADAKWESEHLAKETTMVDDEVPGVPKVEDTDLTDVFPSQVDMERRMQERGEFDYVDDSHKLKPETPKMRTRNFEPDTANLRPYESVRAEYLQKTAGENQPANSMTAEAAANAQIRMQAGQPNHSVQPDYLAGQAAQFGRLDYLTGQVSQANAGETAVTRESAASNRNS